MPLLLSLPHMASPCDCHCQWWHPHSSTVIATDGIPLLLSLPLMASPCDCHCHWWYAPATVTVTDGMHLPLSLPLMASPFLHCYRHWWHAAATVTATDGITVHVMLNIMKDTHHRHSFLEDVHYRDFNSALSINNFCLFCQIIKYPGINFIALIAMKLLCLEVYSRVVLTLGMLGTWWCLHLLAIFGIWWSLHSLDILGISWF